MSSRRFVARPLLPALLPALLLAAACKGAIDGAVYGTDGEEPVPVTDHSVYLLPVSAEIASVLKAACPAEPTDWKQRAESERARLSDAARLYADSARAEVTTPGGTRAGAHLRNMMLLYRDSAARVDARPPTVSGDLIEQLATKQVETGQDGRYQFGDLEPGEYLLAVEVRDEYRWLPVQVARRKATAVMTPSRSRTGCDVARGL